jgi:hypothetical protein
MHICPHELSLVFQLVIFFEVSFYYVLYNYQYIFIRIGREILKLFDLLIQVFYKQKFGKKYYGKL